MDFIVDLKLFDRRRLVIVVVSAGGSEFIQGIGHVAAGLADEFDVWSKMLSCFILNFTSFKSTRIQVWKNIELVFVDTFFWKESESGYYFAKNANASNIIT